MKAVKQAQHNEAAQARRRSKQVKTDDLSATAAFD